jgi:hypothetical protein
VRSRLVKVSKVRDRAGTWSLTRRTYADGTVVEVARGGPPAHARPCLDAFARGEHGEANARDVAYEGNLRKFQREVLRCARSFRMEKIDARG